MTGLRALPGAVHTVRCGGGAHTLRWEAGLLVSDDHADLEGERVLEALGGQPAGCIAVADVWARYVDDPIGLVLLRRSSSDLYQGASTSGGGPRVGGRPITSPRQSAVIWLAAGAAAGVPAAQANDLEVLTGLSVALERRLVATITDTLLADPEQRPALVASLWARATGSLSEWLGPLPLPVDVDVVDAAPAIVRSVEGITARLPLTWVRDVWGSGTTVVAGHFVLAVVARSPDTADLLTVGRDLQAPQVVTVDLR